MGCSASRPDTLLFTKSNNSSPEEDPYSSCCSSSLEYSMVSSSQSPPVPRALSLPTPLVHHPPVKKGDTHHLVSLTSTTYGSLILIDTKTPDINGQDFSDHHQIQSPLHHADQEDSLSPDSVINTWELMDGLDDDFDLDERDISMDSMYRTELQSLLGGKAISLPQVFIRGKHVGGVEEIKQLNESGELAKLLEGFPIRDPRIVCEGCGDARFVPCPNCNGSKKVFEEDEGRLRRCPDCNENGLIRCPGCCS
ncbi:Glutaredoxin [Corchorus olitorius]|uniref:Glutaredoxin n=1 Tax=Corchorus olitorius TaxID=93759 RepID=A0A1R3GD22_9ROSI|nr:Glutaredoxin [Corchorus olitorius]